ncbi:hypothetical protein BBF96_05875 [Anoxybacter fermentans]|uniref:Uncharacterized protein n=1 Tax=Anoxybacter fermentans TaxID=1323375 RepID=A0A3Q9HPS7_9FIRM|nr:DUF6391 domain-containing protein [Anoxybacter fermentans]AZR72963.1 hypothetical protein BBF96_05875 [Anoxybacter fermentans]
MFFILLFFIIILLFPYLLVPFLLILGFMIIFIPYKFTLESIITLLITPGQLIKIAFNPRLRKNHGLEHATVNVLEEYLGLQNLAGYATNDGFYILNSPDPHLVEKAARVGLERLKRGEKDLVIHRRCGTSMVVANLTSAIIFLFLLFKTGMFNIFYVLIAISIANVISPFLSVWVQKVATTSSEVEGMIILGVEYDIENLYWFGFKIPKASDKVFVRTGEIEIGRF